MVITITQTGYIKSLPLATYRQQQRGGRGVTGMDMKDGDFIEHLFVCSSHDFLLFFSNRGKVYRSKVYELPEASRTAKGRALVNVLPLREGERIQSVLSTRDFSETKYLVFATRAGIDQEDRAPGLQHADQGRRHHRDQHPRRRRARRRAQRRPGRRRCIMVSRSGQAVALRGVARCARWAATPAGVHGHERRPEGQRRAGDGRRTGRTRTCSSSPRTASASARRSTTTRSRAAARWASRRSR